MSNRDMCMSIIDNMEEWQLQTVYEMLRTMQKSLDKLESGTLETMRLLSNPELAEKLIEGKKTPLSECIPDSEVIW